MNKQLLCGSIVGAGYTMETFAAALGMNPATLYRKLNGLSDFSRSQILSISRLLKLTGKQVDAIFFANELALA